MAEERILESCVRACMTCHAGCIAAADARVAYSASASMLEIPDRMTDGLLACAKLCGMTAQGLESLAAMQPVMMDVLLEKCRAACVALAERYGDDGDAAERHASTSCRLCAEWCAKMTAHLADERLRTRLLPPD